MSVEIHAGYLEEKLQHAAAVEQHFRSVLSSHAARCCGSESCFNRFLSSIRALRESPTVVALAAVEACHNELCVLQELLEQRDHPFSMVEYEPKLSRGDHRIDFRATNDIATWFVEVKTIHPELKDRWDQYERATRLGRITDGVTIHFEREWMGGELWHNKFSARARMLEYASEFEERITTGALEGPGREFVVALFSDGFAWHEDELEDFVAFYRTGTHRADDGLAKMEDHDMRTRGRSFARLISTFAYCCRPPFKLVPTEVTWNVKPPPKCW
jgi:hypothetical protein